MLLDAREGMILAKQDEREAFVVAEKHVVRRPEALDQLRFEKQRFGLGAGGDDRHRPRLRDHALQPLGQLGDLGVIGDPIPERPRLADVEHVAARILHAIDAGVARQRLQNLADRGHALVEVGLLRPAHGIGRLILVEAIGGAGKVGTVGRGSVHAPI